MTILITSETANSNFLDVPVSTREERKNSGRGRVGASIAPLLSRKFYYTQLQERDLTEPRIAVYLALTANGCSAENYAAYLTRRADEDL